VHQRGSLTDDDRKGVLDAVRLWLTFGGYGARTRRGFGALQADKVSYDDVRLLVTRVKGNASKQRPTLAQCLLLEGPEQDTADKALNALLDALKTFRQDTKFGRDPGKSRPSRSRWPEADSLRKLSGGKFRAHRVDASYKKASAPRAEFGLPINVKFMTKEDTPADGSIAGTKEGGRWASPLLMRPVPRGNKYVPVVLVLAGHRPEKVWIKYKKYNDKKDDIRFEEVPVAYDDATHGGARELVRSVLIHSRGHALDAFATWLQRERNFRKPEGA
jgi:CRISPR-associated protein Cmr1